MAKRKISLNELSEKVDITLFHPEDQKSKSHTFQDFRDPMPGIRLSTRRYSGV
jgi:hypothetical protein